MTDLRTCPFCGGKAEMHGYNSAHRPAMGKHGYRVECMGRCGSASDYWHSKKAALENWNVRK